LNVLVRSALRQDRATAVSNDGLDAAICVVDREARIVRFAGANLPLIQIRQGEVSFIRGDRMSLGYQDSSPDHAFQRHDIAFDAGTSFYLYTDGMTDQVGGHNRRLFGRDRLQQLLLSSHDRSLDDQMEHLFQQLAQWRGGEKRRDDMTFLSFRPLQG